MVCRRPAKRSTRVDRSRNYKARVIRRRVFICHIPQRPGQVPAFHHRDQGRTCSLLSLRPAPLKSQPKSANRVTRAEMPTVKASTQDATTLQTERTIEKDLEIGDELKLQDPAALGSVDESSAPSGDDSKAWKTATQEIPKNNLYLVFFASVCG